MPSLIRSSCVATVLPVLIIATGGAMRMQQAIKRV
jgi:hypothetical protein